MKQKVVFTESTNRALKKAGNNLAVLSFAFDSHVGFDVLNCKTQFDYTQLGGFTGVHSFF
ncbi:MAG: hypothetical protein FWE23_03540 [Chitinivibrionia bacterium]|nr:hypothetical protein [Chitinivibrionia bacterium]